MIGYSQGVKNQVIKAILVDGMPIKEACRVFKISRDTIRIWVRREQGLIPAPSRQAATDSFKAQAVSKVNSGESVKKVAFELGKSLSTVYLWVKEAERKQLAEELEDYKQRFDSLENQ